MKWIHQFGWILLALALTTLVSVVIAIQMTVKSRTAYFNAANLLAPQGSQSLTTGVTSKDTAKPAPTQATTTDAHEADNTPVVDPALLSKTSPISVRPFLFKGLPDMIQAPPSDATQIPILIVSPQARWEDKTLKVSFALQHVSEPPGTQQGRILILARGPGLILTHPDQILQPSDKEILIDPNEGEFFSVSRYREAQASFGPLPSRDWIKEVEIVILSSKGQILIHERITPLSEHRSGHDDAEDGPKHAAPKAAAAPEKTAKATPPAASSPASAATSPTTPKDPSEDPSAKP